MAVQYHRAKALRTTRAGNQTVPSTPLAKLPPAASASHHSATSPMKAGNRITSRDIQEVRHISTARQARILWPRCRNEAASPASSSAWAKPIAASTKPLAMGTPSSSASAISTSRPCPVPARVVKNRMEKAGCMVLQLSLAGVTRRGKYWLAGWVSHSGISA